jgi:ABC-type sugar transport system ATPase subunit
MGSAPSLDIPVEALDLSTRQVCVIARALVQRPAILILDEPTSALDVSTRDRLFGVVQRLCKEGVAVLFISHRMDEIQAIAHRVTVLRSGESVATLDHQDASTEELLRLMSGVDQIAEVAASTEKRVAEGRVVLRVSRLKIAPSSEEIDVEIQAGEIVGVAGLEGHGQERFIRVLAGVDQPAEGEVIRETEQGAVPVRTQADAARYGIAYVPRDRKTEGVFEPLSILDNFSMPTLNRDAVAGVLSEQSRRRRFREYVESLHVRLSSARDKITTLSGGNQQKVIIARWLAMRPNIVILDDPTRGVDLGTKRDIYRLLDQLAESGVAIIMLSTEIEEHITLMDRVVVFREGHLFSELDHASLSRERLIAAFFGRRTGAREAAG